MESESNMSMKLLINSQTNRVLFAEAGNDCVDFLFYILSLPLAAVTKLLREEGMVGCLENLYESIENLSETYIRSAHNKDTFLGKMKKSGIDASASNPLMILDDDDDYGDDDESTESSFYRCNTRHCKHFAYTDDPSAVCPGCRMTMTSAMRYVSPPGNQMKVSSEGGFVKRAITYLVTDELEVKPISTISSLTLLHKYKIKDVGALKEKVVDIGMDEAVKILKASLWSKKVLTEVFLK